MSIPFEKIVPTTSGDAKELAETFTLPKGWSVVKGDLAKVLQAGSQEEVYIKIEGAEKDIKGLAEKRQLKMIMLKRKEASFPVQQDILSFFLIYHLPKTQPAPRQEELEHTYVPDATLVQCITNITRSNEIPQLASPDILISNEGPLGRYGQWSCYHAGLLPEFQASLFFEEMVKHNVFTQEESQFLASVCRRKKSPQMAQLDQSFKTALEKMDFTSALKYAKEMHALSITTNKQAGITLHIPTGKKNNSYIQYFDEVHAGYALGMHLKNLGRLDEALEAFAIVSDDSPLNDKASEEIETILKQRHNGDKDKIIQDLKKLFPNEEFNIEEEDEDLDAKEADEANREDDDIDLESLSTVNTSNLLIFSGPGSNIDLSGGIFISGPSKQTGPVFDFAQGRRYLPADYRDLLEMDDSLPGNIQALKMMIKGGLLKREESHDSFLGQAAAAGKLNIVKTLLQEKVDVNRPSCFGVTPVMQALEKGQMAVVEYLIDNGAILSNSEHALLLSYSAKGKCTAEFLAMMDRKKINYDHLLEYPKYYKLSFEKLIKDDELSEELKIKFLQKMIKNGLLVNEDANRWDTVLMQAIAAKHLTFIDVLLEGGADINQKTHNGTPLRKAISMNNGLIVTRLIQAKADVNQQSNEESVLMFAVKNGNAEMVRLLIQAKADVQYQDRWSETALRLAVKSGNVEMIQLLIQAQADVNHQDRWGETLFSGVVKNGNPEITNLLIHARADVHQRDRSGETLLTLAVSKGNIEMVRLLIQAKVDVNHRLTFGDTALTLALKQGRTKIVELLIENGAQVANNEKDSWKVCCLAAAEQGKCVKELVTALDKKFAANMSSDDSASQQLERKKYGEFNQQYSPTIPAKDLEKILIIGEILTELYPEATGETEENLLERTLFVVKCIYGEKAHHFIKSLLDLAPSADAKPGTLEEVLDPMLSLLANVYRLAKSWFLNESKFFDIYKEYGNHTAARPKR